MAIDTILGIVGTVLGIVGLVTGYIFYRLGLRLKEPCWTILSTPIIRDNISQFSKLEVLYEGNSINNLTSSTILFWNKGRETIDKHDVAHLNPLSIIIRDGCSILSADVTDPTNPANQITVELDKINNIVHIDFEYIDHMDGATIQILHTGKSSSSLSMVGNIKGVKSLQRFPKKPNNLIVVLSIILFLAFGIGFGFGIPSLTTLIIDRYGISPAIAYIASVALSVVFGFNAAKRLISRISPYPSKYRSIFS